MTDEDRYELLGEIGRGAGGVIYRARDRDLGRDVAFKLLRREGSTLDARVRFVAEAQIPAQLEHPNIIPIHDVGRTRDGSLFYVMKLVQGQTLKEHLNGRTSRSELLFAMLQVARGIAFAHHRGVIHRDLKPSNVMIGLFGEVLILDWAPDGNTGDEAVEIARRFQAAGVDIVHVSSGQVVKHERPVYGRMFQVPLSDQIRNALHVPTIAVGNIFEADHVNTIIAAGRADLCALARPHLADPYWTLHAAAEQGVTDVPWPVQYGAGKQQLERNLARATQLALNA